MEDNGIPFDYTAFSVVHSHEEAEAEDRAFWLGKTPHERLIGVEQTRQILYGYDPATARLQRVLEIAQRSPR